VKKLDKIIFHIDVNSAFLSWTAVDMLKNKENIDIRKIPSAIGGDPNNRRGVVLASSIEAKKFGVKTGESLYRAFGKCKNLKVYPPDFRLYHNCSNAMVEILKEYSSLIERFSIDECFLECSHFKGYEMKKAIEIKERIKKELGFTVNIGIGNNKLLAKMASEFEKPDKIHTIYKEEIREKMWNLPVGDLFMVGKASERKLKNLNIKTIGELANYDLNTLKTIFKSFGLKLYQYANGIDNSDINEERKSKHKGIGNSTTLPYDIDDEEDAFNVLLELTNTVTYRLKKSELLASQISVSIRNSDFVTYSHQKTLINPTDDNDLIYNTVKQIFKEMYKHEPIRLLGVRVTKLTSNEVVQLTLF
jgi:DNA polymerase-4